MTCRDYSTEWLHHPLTVPSPLLRFLTTLLTQRWPMFPPRSPVPPPPQCVCVCVCEWADLGVLQSVLPGCIFSRGQQFLSPTENNPGEALPPFPETSDSLPWPSANFICIQVTASRATHTAVLLATWCLGTSLGYPSPKDNLFQFDGLQRWPSGIRTE